MKIVDCILESPSTGICKINVEKLSRCFGFSTISRWHDDYRLCNQRAGIKVTISFDTAKAIIDKLELVEVPSIIFIHGSTFMTKKRAKKLSENHP